jgi:2-haloacid dehalogenase
MQNIIFDLGGVLIEWDPNVVYRNYFANDNEKIQRFYDETGIWSINSETDRGTPYVEVLNKLIEKFPNHKEPITLWHSQWRDMVRGDIPGSKAILNSLHQQKYPLYALTNWAKETFFPFVPQTFNFISYFKDIVISGVEKTCKPELRIYQILLERNNLTAKDCIFIDDRAENLMPAKQLGMDVIQFSSPEQLHDELKNRKIITQI